MTKIAFITGGSGGIGAACARRLKQDGYTVLVQYNTGEERARACGANKLYQADFSRGAEVAAMCANVLRDYKKIDLLVNAAGEAESGLFTDFDEEHIRRILEVNLVSAMTLTRAFVPRMVEQKSGVIINVSSIWGVSGASCEVAYSTAKAGLIGFTKALARELGPSNIRVNCVAPGVIDTPMNKNLTPADLAEIKNKTPLNRTGTTEEIAEAVAFLTKAEFVTGQVLTVDGGLL